MRNQELCITRQGMRGALWLICGAILAVLILGGLPAAAQGIITTVAGNGSYGFSGDGGQATLAALSIRPFTGGIAVDAAGNLYTADTGINRISKTADSIVNPDAWVRASSNLPDSSVRALTVDPFDPNTLYAGTFIGSPPGDGVFKSTNAGAEWAQTGLEDVQVNVLAMDRSQPGALYAGTNGRGLLKSTDGGTTWDSVGPDIPNVSLLTIDPRKSSTILAGDVYGYSGTLFKSTDAGRSWTHLRSFQWASSVAVSPVNLNFLYVSCLTGDPQDELSQSCLWKSTDGGKTWAFHILDNGMYHLVVDPTEPSTLFSIGDIPYKSTDGGSTWTPYDLPIDSIVAEPLNPETRYAISHGSVYRSIDGGGSWSSLTEGLTGVPLLLAISRSNPATVFAVTSMGGLFENSAMLTLNRREYCVGDSWKVNIVNAPANASVRLIGVSNGVGWSWPDWGITDEAGQHSDSGTFVDGTEGSYRLSVEINGIRSNKVSLSVSNCRMWTPANLNLTDGDIRALVVDPVNPETVYAGTASKGVFKSTNAGADWAQTRLANVQVNVLAMDRSQPGALYAGTNGRGLVRSTDGGATWSGSGPNIPNVSLLTIDQRNSSRLLAGYTDRGDFGILFRTTDGGDSWTKIDFPRQYIEFIAVDPQNPDNIYFLDYGYLGMEDAGYLCKTSDGGQNWSCSYLHDIGCMWNLVVDPTDSASLYAGCGEYGSLKSSDGGLTWTPTDLSIESIAANPVEPGTLYAIAGGVVYRSIDSGSTWDSVTQGLTYPAQALAVSGSNRDVVFAGTNGGGVYKKTIGLTLTVDRTEYCVGDAWELNVVYGAAASSIRLVGVSNGVGWEWPDWGMTDDAGRASASGSFAYGTQGTYLLSVETAGVQSNTVSFSVSECH